MNPISIVHSLLEEEDDFDIEADFKEFVSHKLITKQAKDIQIGDVVLLRGMRLTVRDVFRPEGSDSSVQLGFKVAASQDLSYAAARPDVYINMAH